MSKIEYLPIQINKKIEEINELVVIFVWRDYDYYEEYNVQAQDKRGEMICKYIKKTYVYILTYGNNSIRTTYFFCTIIIPLAIYLAQIFFIRISSACT